MPTCRYVSRMGRVGLGLAAIGRPAYITSGGTGTCPATAAGTPCGPGRTSCSTPRTRWASGTPTPPVRTGTPSSSSAPGWTPGSRTTCSWPASGATSTSATGGSDVDTHEVKHHDLATFERQLAESRALLGDRLRLYQVHSLTPDSPLLTDGPLLAALAELRDGGVEVGVSTSGPRQARGGRAGARAVRRRRPAGHLGAVDLEPAGALGRPGAGRRARGRLPGGGQGGGRQRAAGRRRGTGGAARGRRAARVGPDAVAIGAVLAQPWCDVVLSGAVTPEQLASNAAAAPIDADELAGTGRAGRPVLGGPVLPSLGLTRPSTADGRVAHRP